MNKKLLALGLLTLVGVSAVSGDLFAAGRLINRHRSVIICRPYNAFTPICFGNMTCDGCCPLPTCGAPSLPSFQPWCDGGACGYADVANGAMMPMPMPMGQNFTPPPPAINPSLYQSGYQQGVYQTGYQPAYYPNNAGYGYYPPPSYPTAPMPVPYYWYGAQGGR